LKNNGNGTFQYKVDYNAGAFPYSVFAADLDGDGDNDLAVANETSNDISILKNNGNATFQTAVNYGAGTNPKDVFAADLDDDGDYDLAVANEGTHNVSILTNNGNGTFQAPVNYGAGTWPQTVHAADLDSDGDTDLSVANHGSSNVSILKNNGNGTFQTAVDYSAEFVPRSVFAIDLDGDGDRDLATANQASDNISILRNNGNGTFQMPINYAASYDPEAVFGADLNGDGRNDLAVAHSGVAFISILLNRGAGTVSGTVTEIDGNTPIEGVLIRVLRSGSEVRRTTTAANGSYTLANLPIGSYDIEASKSQYVTELNVEKQIVAGETTIVNFQLHSFLGKIQGTVTDDLLNPIIGVVVTDINEGIADTTEGAGYALNRLLPGDHDVSFIHPDYYDTIVTGINLPQADSVTLNVILNHILYGAVVGLVSDTALNPLQGAVITDLYSAAADTSDSTGYFCLSGLPIGSHDFSFVCSTYRDTILYNNDISENDTLDLNVIMTLWQPDVMLCFGNLDSLPLTAPVGSNLTVDLFIKTAPWVYISSLHIPLGALKPFIDAMVSTTYGQEYDLLAQWDVAQFLEPVDMQPDPFWISQSFLAFADSGEFQSQELHFEIPTKVLTYVVHIANNSAYAGDTLQCLGQGFNPQYGGLQFADSIGQYFEDIFVAYSQVILTLSPDNGFIRGRVTNAQSMPMDSVYIYVDGPSPGIFEADENGYYGIPDLFHGLYDLTYHSPLYYDTTISNISVAGMDTIVLDVVMRLQADDYGSIEGTVTDTYGFPIDTVLISIAGPSPGQFQADENGYYFIQDRFHGQYDLTFSSPLYYDTTISNVTVVGMDTTVVNVVMRLLADDYGSIEGTVTDTYGFPIDTVLISVVGPSPGEFEVDDNGYYFIPNRIHGQYDLTFSSPLYYDTTISNVSVVEMDTALVNVVIRLQADDYGFIGGAVTDAYGFPIDSVQISVAGPTPGQYFTDQNGRYFISERFQGQYSLTFHSPDYHDTTINDIIVAGMDTTTLNVLMRFLIEPDVVFWFGNLDGSPINANIGRSVGVDVYIQMSDFAYGGSIHVPLGTDDQYIDTILGGTYYYPLTQWDAKYFDGPYSSPPNIPGWSSMSFIGFANISVPYDDPWLHFIVPQKILTFQLKTINNQQLEGDTAQCIGIGLHPQSGSINFSDTLEGLPYSSIEYISAMTFSIPTGYDYLPGDVNMFGGTWPPAATSPDVTYLVNFFRGLPTSQSCPLGGFWCSADANGDCLIIGGDVTKLVNVFRGLTTISHCANYEPLWPTPADIPPSAPPGWPNCE